MSSSSTPATQSQWRIPVGKGISSLNLVKDASVPKPEFGEVLVRIHAVSLNYRDLLIAKGLYPLKTDPLIVPTSDGAGEVVAVGTGVTQWKVGDKVITPFTPNYIAGDNRHGAAYSGATGGDLPGVLTQYRAFNAISLVRLPSNFSYAEGATLPCAGVTAWNALTGGRTPVRSDHSVLVMGTGGVSIIAAQIARASGARVIATSSSDEKLARLVKIGLVAEGDTINYKKIQDWGKKAKELSGGIGVDHVIEVGGQGTIGQAVEAVRPDGEIVVIGLLDGIHPEVKGIDPMRVLMGGFNVRGLLVGSVAQLNDLANSYAQNPHKPIVDKVFPFTQAKEAYEYLESGAHFGKVVISVE